jgi:hypothetical protein
MSARSAEVSTVVLLLCVSLAQAASNSTARAEAFAKLPDWSGLWEGTISAAVTNPTGGVSSSAESEREFLALFESRLPPLNAALKARYQAARENFVDLPDQLGCAVNSDLLVLMSAPGTLELLVTPNETALLHTMHQVRHIYTDGRAHPAKDDLWPTSMGDSVGHWEGDTLVVDTVATNPEVVIGVVMSGGISKWIRLPLSNQIHIVERIRRVSRNELDDEMTVEDPVSLTRPWQQLLKYTRVTDTNRMIYEDCTENDRNPVVNGKFTATER